VLTERRLRPALEMLAARSSVPVVLDGRLDRRLPSAHEAALYFVAAEALTNVTKYANASAFEVALQRADPRGPRSPSQTTAWAERAPMPAAVCVGCAIESRHSAVI
jgi:hypothetical protein